MILPLTIFFLINLIFFSFIIRKDSSGSFVLSPFLFFCILEISGVWISAFIVEYNGSMPDSNSMFIVSLGFLFLLIGYSIARFSIILDNTFSFFYARKNLFFSDRHLFHMKGNYWVPLLLLSLIMSFISIYHYQGIPPVTKLIISMLTKGSIDTDFIQTSRMLLTKSHIFGGQYRGQGLITSFMINAWPFIFGISLLMYFAKKTRLWLYTSIIYGFISIIFITGDGSRAQLVTSMIYIFILLSLIKNISYKSLFSFFGTTVIVILLISIPAGRISFQEKGISENLVQVIKRLTADDGINTMHVLQFVNDGTLDFYNGRLHMQKAILALPGSSGGVPFSRKLSELLRKSSKTSFTSTTYLATVYLDFGIYGVIIIYFMMGFLFGIIHYFFFSFKKTPVSVGMWAMVCLQLGLMSSWGIVGLLSSFIVNFTVLFLFIFFKVMTDSFIKMYNRIAENSYDY